LRSGSRNGMFRTVWRKRLRTRGEVPPSRRRRGLERSGLRAVMRQVHPSACDAWPVIRRGGRSSWRNRLVPTRRGFRPDRVGVRPRPDALLSSSRAARRSHQRNPAIALEAVGYLGRCAVARASGAVLRSTGRTREPRPEQPTAGEARSVRVDAGDFRAAPHLRSTANTLAEVAMDRQSFGSGAARKANAPASRERSPAPLR